MSKRIFPPEWYAHQAARRKARLASGVPMKVRGTTALEFEKDISSKIKDRQVTLHRSEFDTPTAMLNQAVVGSIALIRHKGVSERVTIHGRSKTLWGSWMGKNRKGQARIVHTNNVVALTL